MPVTTTTLDQLATNVLQRLQDDEGVFWSREFEATPSVAEAINDLLLLVGRPTLVYNQLVTLTANSVWQDLPDGLLCITDIRSSTYKLYKTTIHDMDFTQASWGSDWVNDRADVPERFGPVGLSSFFVHPAPTTDIQVTIAGVSLPIQSAWPFAADTQSPFSFEFDVALEMYGAAYCRLKDLGIDSAEANVLRQQYLSLAQQMTRITDRRDPVIFSQTLGVPSAVSNVSLR